MFDFDYQRSQLIKMPHNLQLTHRLQITIYFLVLYMSSASNTILRNYTEGNLAIDLSDVSTDRIKGDLTIS